jgi:hypothetical protein
MDPVYFLLVMAAIYLAPQGRREFNSALGGIFTAAAIAVMVWKVWTGAI